MKTSDTPSTPDRLAVAAAVRRACAEAAARAFEEGGLAGLCVEGRVELALDAIRAVDLGEALREAERSPSR